jgi:hypothetical protein
MQAGDDPERRRRALEGDRTVRPALNPGKDTGKAGTRIAVVECPPDAGNEKKRLRQSWLGGASAKRTRMAASI